VDGVDEYHNGQGMTFFVHIRHAAHENGREEDLACHHPFDQNLQTPNPIAHPTIGSHRWLPFDRLPSFPTSCPLPPYCPAPSKATPLSPRETSTPPCAGHSVLYQFLAYHRWASRAVDSLVSRFPRPMAVGPAVDIARHQVVDKAGAVDVLGSIVQYQRLGVESAAGKVEEVQVEKYASEWTVGAP
jgi:hypothetical protein